MCSRHPEEGAGSEFVHFDPGLGEIWWYELHSPPEPLRRPVWLDRVANGGWDHPQDSGPYRPSGEVQE